MREEVNKRILRMVSVVVVLNLAFGGFLGLMLVEENVGVEALTLPRDLFGNIVITSPLTIDGSTLPNGTLSLDANLTVTGAGYLKLIDTIAVFQIDTAHRFSCSVQNQGTLELINSTITVETSDDPGALFDNYEDVYWFNSSDSRAKFKRMIPFNIDITGINSRLYMEDSALKYEGSLNIINGANATV